MRTYVTGLAAACFGIIISTFSVIAAEEHTHVGKHGGKVVESGHHHLEIVARDGTLEVHVSDEDGKPEDLRDVKATAAVLSGGKKTDVTLAADAANVLKGTGEFAASKGTTIVITLTLPGHKLEQVRVKLE